MSEEAKNQDGLNPEDQDTENPNEDEAAVATLEEEEGQGAEDSEEEGTETEGQEDEESGKVKGSQPKTMTAEEVSRVVQQRVNKVNEKVDEAKGETDKAKSDLELVKERNKLLELALEQKKADPSTSALVEPKPEDFDGNEYDPAYLKAQREYDKAEIRNELKQDFAEENKRSQATNHQVTQTQEMELKRVKHYERAIEMGVKDFDSFTVTEDRVIVALGGENVDAIISGFDDSHVLVNFLGNEKNSSDLERIAALNKSNPFQAVIELGRLSEKLKVKPKSKIATPNPDEPLEGATPSGKKGSGGPKGAKFSFGTG